MFYVFILIIVVFLISAAYAGLSAAPWVPTHKKDLLRILKLANLKPSEVFYELGCGDGRLLKKIAKKGNKSVGFEINLLVYLIAKVRCLFNKNCQVKYKNFWKVNLKEVDVIYFFLMPKVLEKVHAKLMAELKPGARIISYVWPLPDLKPLKIDQIENQANLFLYQKPLTLDSEVENG